MTTLRLFYPLAVSLLIFSTTLFSAEIPDADAFLQMGHSRKNSGDLDGAIEFYKKSLEINPNFEAAKLSLIHAIDEKNIIFFSKNFPKSCQIRTTDFDRALECAQKYFLIGGQPINPMIIKDLTTWLSDEGDQTIAINLLDSQKSNKYFCDRYEAQKNGKYFSVEILQNSKEDYSFDYKIEGLTDNGIYVIRVAEWGAGGTGVFSSLLFVRIRKGMGFGNVENNRLTLNQKRILIEKLGAMGLGDRAESIITVQGNSVLVESKQGLPPYEKNTKKIMISLESN